MKKIKTKINSNFYLTRVFYTRGFMLMTIYLFLLMNLTHLLNLKDYLLSKSHIFEEYRSDIFSNTFINYSGTHNYHFTINLIIDLLPLIIFIMISKTIVEDIETNFITNIKIRTNIKKYYQNTLIYSFSQGFIVMFIALIFNLLVIYLLNLLFNFSYSLQEYNGIEGVNSYVRQTLEQDCRFSLELWQIDNPFLAYLIYFILNCLFFACLTVIITSLGMIFQKQYQVLIMSFLIYQAIIILGPNFNFKILDAISMFAKWSDVKNIIIMWSGILITTLSIALLGYFTIINEGDYD